VSQVLPGARLLSSPLVTVLLTVVAVLVVGWFAAGTLHNVRKGSALMRWMQGGLPLIGARTTVRWLGTTAVEMVIREAKAPFAEVVLLVFMEPRDVPWMWALSRRGGRRDTLIIRARLRRAPRVDLEALEPRSWSGHDALRRMPAGEWPVHEPSSAGGLPVYARTPSAIGRAEELVALANRAGMTVRRLSVRRTEPHLQLHVALPSAAVPAASFFEAVRELGERAPA
jgi:hypothetical protein